MYHDYKIKKGYLKIIATILIWGLLCPQVLLAEEAGREIEGSQNSPILVTFKEYEELNEREKELLEDCEEIKEFQKEKDKLEIVYIIDADGNLVQLAMKSDGLNLTVVFRNTLKSEVEEFGSESTDNTITPAQLNNDEFYIADVDIKGIDKTSSELLEISGDKLDSTNTVKEDISILLKIHESAMKEFYIDVELYYSNLESALKKAQWLWREQGIDPHLYYGGADGVLDDGEIRCMVEESLDYLYKNIPTDAEVLDQRNEILGFEETLRVQYVEPALELYKRELKEASSAFYRSIEEKIKPLISPFINKTNGGIEVIINLPREAQE